MLYLLGLLISFACQFFSGGPLVFRSLMFFNSLQKHRFPLKAATYYSMELLLPTTDGLDR